MLRIIFSLCLVLVLGSCQQRYWQVKKVKVQPRIEVEKPIIKNENAFVLDSLRPDISQTNIAANPIELQQDTASINQEIKSENKREVKSEITLPKLKLISKIRAKNSIPFLYKSSNKPTNPELLFIFFIFLISLVICVALFGFLGVFVLEGWFITLGASLSEAQILAISIWILLLFLVLAFYLGYRLIKKKLKRKVDIKAQLLMFVLAMLGALLILEAAFAGLIGWLLILALLVICISLIARFDRKNKY